MITRKAIANNISSLKVIKERTYVLSDKAVIEDTIRILRGYLRILLVLSQFRITLVTFFEHYPELFNVDND